MNIEYFAELNNDIREEAFEMIEAYWDECGQPNIYEFEEAVMELRGLPIQMFVSDWVEETVMRMEEG